MSSGKCSLECPGLWGLEGLKCVRENSFSGNPGERNTGESRILKKPIPKTMSDKHPKDKPSHSLAEYMLSYLLSISCQ